MWHTLFNSEDSNLSSKFTRTLALNAIGKQPVSHIGAIEFESLQGYHFRKKNKMNEIEIKKLTAELLKTFITRLSDFKSTDKEIWLESYAAIAATKKIVENNPIVFFAEITPEEALEAEHLGLELAESIIGEADKLMNFQKN